MLVMASMRLRLTAYSLAGMQAPEHVRQHGYGGMTYAQTALAHATADLTGFYERVAVLVGRPVAGQVLMPASVPEFTGLNGNGRTRPTAEVSETDGVAMIAEGEGPDLIRVVTAPRHPHLLWVAEHLQHLNSHAHVITDPASHVAEQRRLPWWR